MKTDLTRILSISGQSGLFNYVSQAAVAAKLGDSGRILVRESGTEPVIRVMVEAPDQETCETCVQQVIDTICAKGHAVV